MNLEQGKQGPIASRAIDEHEFEFMLSACEASWEYTQRSWDLLQERLEFLVTVVTAAVGGILLIESQAASLSQWLPPAIGVGVALFGIGVLTYVNCLSIHIAVLSAWKDREGLQRYFVERFPIIADYNAVQQMRVFAEYGSWASLRGILKRAVGGASVKTLVAVTNSVVLALVVMGLTYHYLGWSSPWALPEALGILAFLLSSVSHGLYALLRYHTFKRSIN